MAEKAKPFKRTVTLDQSQGAPSIGLHRAKCIEAGIVPIKSGPNQGGENLYLNFEVLTPGEAGRRVRTWLPLLEQTAWKYTRVLQAFGIKPKGDSKQVEITDKAFVGKVVRLQISHRDNRGETVGDIDNILPDGDAKKAGGSKDDLSSVTKVESAEIPDEDEVSEDLPF